MDKYDMGWADGEATRASGGTLSADHYARKLGLTGTDYTDYVAGFNDALDAEDSAWDSDIY